MILLVASFALSQVPGMVSWQGQNGRWRHVPSLALPYPYHPDSKRQPLQPRGVDFMVALLVQYCGEGSGQGCAGAGVAILPCLPPTPDPHRLNGPPLKPDTPGFPALLA